MVVIVVLYILFMLAVGFWASKKYIYKMSDFLLAGRRLGLVLCSFTLAATHFGGGVIIGGGEYGWKSGYSGVWYGVACGLGLILLGLVTAKKFRSLSLYTVPDYLEKRYRSKTLRLLGALISTFALTGLVGACTLAAKSAFSVLGLEGNIGFYIAAFVFISYTTIGGLWAVSLTDFLQLSISAVGVLLGFILVLVKTGGFSGLEQLLAGQGVDSSYFSFIGMDFKALLLIILPTVMYTLVGQDFYQRLFAAKDPATAKRGAVLSGFIVIVLSFFPIVMGMGAKALSGADLGTEAVPWVVKNLMPPILGGIVLAAILAAVMSTADSLLTAATSHAVKDFWVEIFHIDSMEHEKRLLMVSRIFTLALGVAAVLIAMVVPSLITAIIWSYSMYTASVFIPVIGGVLWERGTKAGALTALIGGAAITFVGILTEMKIFGFPAEIYGAVCSLALFVVVSLVSKEQMVEGTLSAAGEIESQVVD